MTPTPLLVRRAIATATLTCTAAFIAACGSSPGSSAPAGAQAPPAQTSTAAPPSSPAAPAASTPAASPASQAAQNGPAPCPTRSLKLKLGVAQGTAGSVYTVIDFTNISNVTCTLYGYPGVSLASGPPVTQIGKSAMEDPTTPRQLVTLQPNTTGNALLRIVDAGNYPASRCHPVNSRYLQIYPPNQTTPVYLRYKTQGCAKPVNLLTIDVVKPGSGSS